jgi:hypothetical protein
VENQAMAGNSRHRLDGDEVARYREYGYLVLDRPVFSAEQFAALRAHFEGKLAALPADARPEAMDVPHFRDPRLFEWLFADEVLDLVEPILGPDIALFSSHFICKPRGDGKRVPWHEDSYYWKGMLEPMEVCTVWLAIDPSTSENGCMNVIPRSHDRGLSEYEPVDMRSNVFPEEARRHQVDESRKVAVELEANQCSLHDARLMHGSDANTSERRRCGYTMRYMSTRVRFNHERMGHVHQIYLARGRDLAGNVYADPGRSSEELARDRERSSRNFH